MKNLRITKTFISLSLAAVMSLSCGCSKENSRNYLIPSHITVGDIIDYTGSLSCIDELFDERNLNDKTDEYSSVNIKYNEYENIDKDFYVIATNIFKALALDTLNIPLNNIKSIDFENSSNSIIIVFKDDSAKKVRIDDKHSDSVVKDVLKTLNDFDNGILLNENNKVQSCENLVNLALLEGTYNEDLKQISFLESNKKINKCIDENILVLRK